MPGGWPTTPRWPPAEPGGTIARARRKDTRPVVRPAYYGQQDRRSLRSHATPGVLGPGPEHFLTERTLLRGGAARTLLPPELLEVRTRRRPGLVASVLQLIEQSLACQPAVVSLLPRSLALHLDSARPVEEDHTGGGLVDVLPPVTSRTYERLIEVRLANPQCGHPTHLGVLTSHGIGTRTRHATARSLPQLRPSCQNGTRGGERSAGPEGWERTRSRFTAAGRSASGKESDTAESGWPA